MPTYNNPPSPSDHFQGKWDQKLIEDLQLAGKAKRTVDGYVRAFAQHILPAGFQKVRYYGFMSSNNKLQLEDVRWLIWLWLGWTFWLGSGRFQPQPRQRETPLCDRCGDELELIGMTNADDKLIWSKSQTRRGPPCD